MVMSRIWSGIVFISIVAAILMERGSELSSAVAEGAQSGVQLAMAMGGSICLWTGVGRLMEAAGFTRNLARLLSPLLHRVFPGTRRDAALAGYLSANISANFLGLGNAATPMGICAVQRMKDPRCPGIASDEMCRLVVLNTASIQLIPANVAAIRASLGSHSPFDILPAVWISSLSSAALGLGMAWLLGRVWRRV